MPDPETRQKILELIQGYRLTQAVYCAAELKLADRLADGPKSPQALAVECAVLPMPLSRLLRALASLGIFKQLPGKGYENTPLSQCLRSDIPNSQWATAMLAGTERYKAFDHMLDSLRTGATGFAMAFGKPLFEYMRGNPSSARIFDMAMTGLHGEETAQMLASFDFSPFKTLADIGGGNASLLIELAQNYPGLQGILFDLPDVIENAQRRIASVGLAGRIAVRSGDFFKDIPVTADAYLMRHIIHDWDDERCLALLKTLRGNFPPQGRLLLVENVMDEGDAPHPGKMLDLGMLVVTGGMERTAGEFRDLLARGGFQLNRIVPTEGSVSILEGGLG